MAQKFLYSLRSFEKGINDKDSPNLIADNALVDAENAILGFGHTTKRYGYVKHAELTTPITKLYEYHKNDGTKETLVVSNSELHKEDAGVLSALTGVLTSDNAKLIVYKDRDINDVVLIADGGKLKVYDGTEVKEVTPHTASTSEQTDPGSNDLANLTNFRTLAIKKDRIFTAAHPTQKNRVSFCHHDATIGYAVYDYFPATFFFDVATDDNDEIVELKVFRDAIVIFCKRSIWALYGDGRTLQDYELIKINVPAGCIAPNSIVPVGNSLFYLSDEHVYELFNTEQNFLSANIISTVPSTRSSIDNTLNGISREDKEKAVGTYYDGKYYLSFPSGVTLVFDTDILAWTKFTNIQANSFLNREGVLYFATNTGKIYKFDETVYNDDGQPIPFKIVTKNLDFGYQVQDKKFRRLWTIAKQYEAEQSSFTVKAKIDYVETEITDISTDQSLVWDEGNWDQVYWDFVDVVQNELRIRERGTNIQLIVTNNELDQPLVLYGLVLQYKLKRP